MTQPSVGRGQNGAPSGNSPDSGCMEISLNNIHQLFNSLDPSPFHEKDLDDDAEHYLVSWAQDMPREVPLRLILHLREPPSEPQPEAWIAQAIFRHFSERARLTRSELKQLFRQGRISLAIGLLALVAFLLLAQALGGTSTRVLPGLLRESLSIAGWVAMWRPMQIYLYDWWPLRARANLFLRMSRMPVTLRVASA